MKRRFERLGLTPEDVGMGDRLAAIDQADQLSEYAREDLLDAKLYEQSLFRAVAAICLYLRDDQTAATDLGRDALWRADVYYFGEWRQTFKAQDSVGDPDYWKRNGAWMRLFEYSLFLGSVDQEWNALEKLSNYPTAECGLDPTFKEGDRALLVAIADYIRHGAPTKDCYAWAVRAASGDSKRAALLTELLLAITASSETKVQACLLDYLRYYKRVEFPGRQITKKLCLMGTFFLELGARVGLKMEVPPEFAHFIVKSREVQHG